MPIIAYICPMDIDKDLLTLLVQDYATLPKHKQEQIYQMALQKEYYELLAVLKQYTIAK